MKTPSVPLLIGSNDLSAYKMTPISCAHNLLVGDFLQTNEPIEFSGLLPYQDWSVTLKEFQHQKATATEIEKYDTKLKSEIAKMNKAVEPEKKIYSKDVAEEIAKQMLYMNRAAMSEHEDHLSENGTGSVPTPQQQPT